MTFNKEHTYRLILMSSDIELIGDYEANFCSKKHLLDWSRYQAVNRGQKLGLIYVTDLTNNEGMVYTAGGRDWVHARIKAMEKKDNAAAIEIGKRLHDIRIKKDISIEEACYRAGIKQSTLIAIEAGAYNTGIRQISDVAKVLGAHVEIVED